MLLNSFHLNGHTLDGSLPLLHTFICFVSVLRLANSGFVQCFYLGSLPPFAHVYLFCQCASPRKHRVCVALPFCTRLFMSVCFASQTPGLCCAISSLPYKFVRLYALFVLYNRFCVAHFALQASGLLGPKPKFLFGLVFPRLVFALWRFPLLFHSTWPFYSLPRLC